MSQERIVLDIDERLKKAFREKIRGEMGGSSMTQVLSYVVAHVVSSDRETFVDLFMASGKDYSRISRELQELGKDFDWEAAFQTVERYRRNQIVPSDYLHGPWIDDQVKRVIEQYENGEGSIDFVKQHIAQCLEEERNMRKKQVQ